MRTVQTIVGHILVPASLTRADLAKLTKGDMVELLIGESIPEAAAALGIVKG
ncbi:hypothetical protein [Aeromonas sanarellii]|uniref:hypothetical protein n=1 Tax=Aeromonas sanarellii TaxID=633415 RepID=UPI003BA0B101